MSVNKAILIGNVGKPPELKYTSSGKAVTSFTLATTEYWNTDEGRKEQTVWHNIVAWDKQAELIKEYVDKGHKVYIEGRIVNRSYDDKDGNKKYISEVVVQTVQFLTSKDADKAKSDSSPNQPQDTSGDDDGLPF